MKIKQILVTGAVLFILFILGLAASVVYTERPKFCISCHMMQPYYDSWKTSSHKEVNCIECHYEPNLKAHIRGKLDGLVQVIQYLTKRYSFKPTAEVSDATCLKRGCHDKAKLINSKIIFKGKVNFNHSSHFTDSKAGIKLKCTSCHMQLTSDKHIAVEESTCFICHFKNLAPEKSENECLKCHAVIKDDSGHQQYLASGSKCLDCHDQAKKGDGATHKQNCYFCHSDKKIFEKIKDYSFMHKVHIQENKIDCISCHDIIEHN